MNDSGIRCQILVRRLFEHLLHLYPPHFRGEFSAEIRAVFADRLGEAEAQGRAAWLYAAFQEISALVISIPRECWHEHRAGKEKTMVPDDQPQRDGGTEGGGMPALRPAGTPGVLWAAGWTLLTTAALPAAFVAIAPLAVMFTWLINLGVKAGFWPAAPPSTPELLGSLISLALLLASAQWYLLHKFLPKAWVWFIATGAGLLLGLLPVWLSLGRFSGNPILFMATILLPAGLALGLAQWLYLRRFLPNAFWIIVIDVLAAGSILLIGEGISNPVELMVLFLPGVITGLGILFLLNHSHPNLLSQRQKQTSQKKGRRLPRFARIGIGLAALVPLFFGCIWVYAASQLNLAKNEGIYATVEEAVVAINSQGYGGAEVVRIEDVRAGVNQHDGSQPHVWFGTATVYLDRIPQGSRRDQVNAGSFFLHVEEGWVHVPEGAFPKFIGWVMELYHMEGVNR